jgi:hypothetical protein
VASFQGARITDIESGKSIFDGGLSLEKALEVLDAVDTPELTPMAYGDSEFYVPSENHYTIAYKNAVGLKCIVTDVRKFVKERKNGIFKICWVGDDGVVNAVCDRLNARYNGVGVRFNSGAKGLLEAINPDCSKGAAVRFLANYYGFGLDEVITVGARKTCYESKGLSFGDVCAYGYDGIVAEINSHFTAVSFCTGIKSVKRLGIKAASFFINRNNGNYFEVSRVFNCHCFSGANEILRGRLYGYAN